MRDTEGPWHELLNHVRKSFRLRMDGDISQNQRALGLEYGINFGVSIMHLKEIAKDLPQESSLADIMWDKNVREMKLLSLLIRPKKDLTTDKALALCKECQTREVAEQLVIHQLRDHKDARNLLMKIFDLRLPANHAGSIIPYLLLIQLSYRGEVSLEMMNKLINTICGDLASDDMILLTAINNSLNRLAEEPQLRGVLMYIASTSLSQLPSTTSGHKIVQNLKEILLDL